MKEEIEIKEKWILIIKPTTAWFDLNLIDVWNYRDLLFMFVKRDFVSMYKQTILGPLWFLLQPILTTFLFVIIFGRVARLPTDEVPAPLFYLSGLVIWNYFSTCLTNTATTFTKNTDLFGKVYFPRLIVPLATVISALISFAIQFGLLLLVMEYYYAFKGTPIRFSWVVISIPFLVLLIAFLGLGLGIIISALTAKYRDLVYLVTFGVQLLMYATPIIYPLSFVTGKYKSLILANPITPLVESFRYALLGVGSYNHWYLVYSMMVTLIFLVIGVLVFNKVQSNFIDVI